MFRKGLILLYDNLKISLQMLSSHKLRSLLSVVGIVFGILTLLVTLAIGEGTKRKIMKTIEAMGVNLISVTPRMVSDDGRMIHERPLTLREVQCLNQLQGIVAYAPFLSSALMMKIGPVEKVISLEGTTPAYASVRDLVLHRGRFLVDEDVARNAKVAVIGADLAQELFPHEEALGKACHLWDSSFQIVGVLARKGTTWGVDFDHQILLPVTALQEIQGQAGEIHGVWIRAMRSDLTKSVVQQTQALLAGKNLEIWDQEELLLKKNRVTNAFKWALGAIAMVSLLIGGIGIMNVLLVSVSERVKEIGIRKAVGAAAWDILFQFIFESFLLTFVGAFLGVVFGVVISDSIAWILNYFLPMGEKWEAVVSWGAVGVAFHFTFWVGLTFGLYPAWKASRLDSCEALSYF